MLEKALKFSPKENEIFLPLPLIGTRIMKSFETLDWNKNYKIKADISFPHTKVIPFHTQAFHVDVSADQGSQGGGQETVC